MNKENSFEADDRKCPYCKSIQFYFIKYDAYFCKKCNKWLESNCKDPKCKFCVDRPKKPLSNEPNTKNKSMLISMNELSSSDANVRKNAACEIRKAAEKGLDISSTIPALLKLLSNKNAEDILYEYVYTNPDEMSDYDKYLDIYDSFLALSNFCKAKSENVMIVLKEIKKIKVKVDKWWVKELVGSIRKVQNEK